MTGNDEPEGHSSSDGVPILSAWATDQAWLAEADRDRAEERFDRLAGDRDLATALQSGGYRGRNYELFANEIAKYGLGCHPRVDLQRADSWRGEAEGLWRTGAGAPPGFDD